MTDVKKPTAKAAAVKPVAAVKAEEKKVETVKSAAVKPVAEVKKEETAKVEVKAAESVKKAEPVKKTAAKKTTTAKKTTKTAAKKAEPAEKKTTAKKAAAKANVHIQFADKSYSAADIMNIMKDVWTYDLNQKEADLKDVELYVKPEESAVYYVVNGEISGKFAI